MTSTTTTCGQSSLHMEAALPLYHQQQVTRVSEQDVQVQGRLGSGAFSAVFLVRLSADALANVDVGDDNASVASDLTDETFPESHRSYARSLTSDSHHTSVELCLQQHPPAQQRKQQTMAPQHCALKRLRADVIASHGDARQVAVEDFRFEAEILSHLLPPHPNVVRLMAMSAPTAPAKDAFLILEKLDETLEFRLGRWETRQRLQRKLSGGPRLWNRLGRRAVEMHEQAHRLRVAAVGLARAMQHLHAHNILYRDLKPANVGFAADGTVRLFDFGMARCCNDQERRLTGAAGTARYMAPEVAQQQQDQQGYGLSADVYSFGMVLWQVCSLQKPFAHVKQMDDWFKLAVTLQKRPPLRPVMAVAVRDLIQACWSPDAEARPSFALVVNQLETVTSPPKSER